MKTRGIVNGVLTRLFGNRPNSIWWIGFSVVLFGFFPRTEAVWKANLSISYTDPSGPDLKEENGFKGIFGRASRVEPEQGTVVHVHTTDNKRHACTPITNIPSGGRWIALIQRGECRFREKIYNAAVKGNASAVVIYNHQDESEYIWMTHENVNDIVSVFILKHDGEHIANLVDSGITVKMNIYPKKKLELDVNPGDKKKSTMLLIVSMVIIMCLLACLALLLIYAVKRQRYQQEKNRRQPAQLQEVLSMEDTVPSQQQNLLEQDSPSA